MDVFLQSIAGHIALAVEAMAVVFVAYGALEAFLKSLGVIASRPAIDGRRKAIWVSFGMWLLLGLQFALAADIVRSAISPTWEDVGRLAAIAGIRTFLNYFLERDVAEYSEAGSRPRSAEG